MIQLKDITFSYNTTVVIPKLNLDIVANKITCFLGHSGCGKTTLLRLIAGLETLNKGSIYIDNTLVSTSGRNLISSDKRNIGYIFQDLALWPHFTVYKNIAFGLEVNKKPNISEKVNRLLDFFGLSDYKDKYPNELSGGQKQLVAIARSLVMEPSILLMDEPLSNLDVKLKQKIRTYIKKIQKEFQLTIVYVTHDHREAFALANHIVVLDKGMVIEKGSVSDIKKSENHFIKEFIEY